jgi:hypothetical protein
MKCTLSQHRDTIQREHSPRFYRQDNANRVRIVLRKGRRDRPVVPEGVQDLPFARIAIGAGDPAVFDADANGGQLESGAATCRSGFRVVNCDAGLGIDLVQK